MKILKSEEPAHGGFQITDDQARDFMDSLINGETRVIDKYKTDWWMRPCTIYKVGRAWEWIEAAEQASFDDQVSNS